MGGPDDREWVSLQAAVIVIAAFEPVVAGAVVAEIEFADPFEIFYTVFNGDNEAKRRAVAGVEGFAVHLIAEEGLGMHRAGGVDTDIVFVVGSGETDIAEGGFLLKAVVRNEVAEFYAAPPGDLAPSFDAFEFEREFGEGKALEVVDADPEFAIVERRYVETPVGGDEAVGIDADAAVVADVGRAGGGGVGGGEMVGAKGVFEDFAIGVEGFAEG